MDSKKTIRDLIKNGGAETSLYAKDKLTDDQMVLKFILDVWGNVDILKQPVCPKCEGIAAWHTDNRIHCPKCGDMSREGVLTLDRYLKEILKERRAYGL